MDQTWDHQVKVTVLKIGNKQFNKEEDAILSVIRKPETNIVKRTRTDHYWNDIYLILDESMYTHYYRKCRESMVQQIDIILN